MNIIEKENAFDSHHFTRYIAQSFDGADSHFVRDMLENIIYEEIMEGFEEPIRNVIKFREREMNLMKRGMVNVYMAFEEHKKNVTNYLTPYGSLLIGMDTRRVKFTEGDEEIRLQVEYALEANYEYLADCRIEIRVQPAGKTMPDARMKLSKKDIADAKKKPHDKGESDSRMRM